jgi:hypothetical protein
MIIYLLSSVGLIISIGFWVYTDAKPKSSVPEIWTVIAILSFPWGIIAYLIAMRKTQKHKNKYKKYLLIFIVLFIISTIMYIGETIRWIITTPPT